MEEKVSEKLRLIIDDMLNEMLVPSSQTNKKPNEIWAIVNYCKDSLLEEGFGIRVNVEIKPREEFEEE